MNERHMKLIKNCLVSSENWYLERVEVVLYGYASGEERDKVIERILETARGETFLHFIEKFKYDSSREDYLGLLINPKSRRVYEAVSVPQEFENFIYEPMGCLIMPASYLYPNVEQLRDIVNIREARQYSGLPVRGVGELDREECGVRTHTGFGVQDKGTGEGYLLYSTLSLLAVEKYNADEICSMGFMRSSSANKWWEDQVRRGFAKEEEKTITSPRGERQIGYQYIKLSSFTNSGLIIDVSKYIVDFMKTRGMSLVVPPPEILSQVNISGTQSLEVINYILSLIRFLGESEDYVEKIAMEWAGERTPNSKGRKLWNDFYAKFLD